MSVTDQVMYAVVVVATMLVRTVSDDREAAAAAQSPDDSADKPALPDRRDISYAAAGLQSPSDLCHSTDMDSGKVHHACAGVRTDYCAG